MTYMLWHLCLKLTRHVGRLMHRIYLAQCQMLGLWWVAAGPWKALESFTGLSRFVRMKATLHLGTPSIPLPLTDVIPWNTEPRCLGSA